MKYALQTPKHNDLVRDKAFDVVNPASRTGMKNDVVEREKLPRYEDVTTDVVIDLKMSHRSFLTTHQDLYGPPMLILKPADLG